MGIVWIFLLKVAGILLEVGGAPSWLINFLLDSWDLWLHLELLSKALDKCKSCLDNIYLRRIGLFLMELTNVKRSYLGAARTTQIFKSKSNEYS